MDSSRRKLLLRGAKLMATATAGQTGLLGKLLAQTQAPKGPEAIPGMVYHQDPIPKSSTPPRPWLHPERLARFVDPLPIPQPMRSSETRPHPHQPGVTIPYHRVALREVQVKVHRDVPATSVWSYGDSAPGPTIEARK